MSWMKNIYTDIETLNEKVLDIYSENEILAPYEAIEPMGEYLAETGWKSPTEMLAMRRDIIERLAAISATADPEERAVAQGDLHMHLMDAFGIDLATIARHINTSPLSQSAATGATV